MDLTDIYIKDNLENIVSGKWDNDFTAEEIKNLIERSFILNHIKIEYGFVVFSFNDLTIKIMGSQDIPTEDSIELIISSIKDDDLFRLALSSFLREWKINNLGL